MAEQGLNQGLEMPRLGYGTWGRTGDEGEAAILFALETGYRHIDTAQGYGTEPQVGAAVRRSGLGRDEVFVTTKVAEESLHEVKPSLRRSLDALGMDRVDLALIHWPARKGGPALEEYVTAIAEAQAEGMARHIGVSNFTTQLIDRTLEILGPGSILTNQVELNPLFRNRKLADHCEERGILVTCYEPIARGRVAEDGTVRRIAEAHGATPVQVALAWELAKGWAAIPTSSQRERIAENFGALEVSLSPDEVEALDGLDRGVRSIDPDWGPDWD